VDSVHGKQQPATISTQAGGSQQPASSSRRQCHNFWDRLIVDVDSEMFQEACPQPQTVLRLNNTSGETLFV